MKKIIMILIYSFLFLLVSSVSAYLMQYSAITNFWITIAIATSVLMLGIVLLVMIRRFGKLKICVFFINAISMGIYLRAWYIFRSYENGLLTMIMVSLMAIGIFVLFVLLSFIPFINYHYKWFLLIFVIFSLVGYIILLVNTETTWVSTLGYYGILVLSFILGMSAEGNDENSIYNVLILSSFSVGLCGIIIILLALDAADGIDLGMDIFGFDSINPPYQLRNKKPN